MAPMSLRILKTVGVLVLGIAIGGFLFSKSIPRSFLAVAECGSSCYRPNDLAGLMASAGIQRMPGAIPGVVAESDQCIVIQHPKPEARVHFVLFPKQDVKNIGTLTAEDQAAVVGCFALVRNLASTNNAQNYRLITNGPALQHVTYLHFHFLAQ
jgi:hypothetical protein